MDLSSLSLSELRTLQDDIKKQMKKREQDDLSKAREQILAIAPERRRFRKRPGGHGHSCKNRYRGGALSQSR